MKDNSYKINNLDSTICAQSPKLQPFIENMRQNIAQDLETSISNVSVKATTEEFLGISGSQNGMTSYSVVLLNKC
jgi:2-C-methyl-D-erythritol 2,4-cyclodiphosphate synthase